MHNFTGRFLHQDIVSAQAESPSDLYELLKSDVDPAIVDLRCWLLLEAKDGPVWMETLLGLPRHFELLKSLFDKDDIRIEFRPKTQPSPNSSPAKGHGQGDESDERNAKAREVPADVATSTPSLDAKLCIDRASATNEVDPFTLKSVSEASVPFALRFADGEYLCLESKPFEEFVSKKLADGTNLTDLELKHVRCRDNTVRSFLLTKNVWVRSVLHGPPSSRNTFSRYLEWSIEREDQLLELAENKDLMRRVLFWVSEFLDFPASGNRLTEPLEEGIPPFMTPFYFSKHETNILGNLRMPNHVVLREQLALVLGEKERAGVICASHDVFPILAVAFGIRRGFQKDPRFRKDKKKWIKRRETDIEKDKQ